MKKLLVALLVLFTIPSQILSSTAHNFKIYGIDYVTINSVPYFAIKVYGPTVDWTGSNANQRERGGFLISVADVNQDENFETILTCFNKKTALTLVGNESYVLTDRWEFLSSVTASN